jgi:hypothetical protein
VLPSSGTVLEFGSGRHAACFAVQLPHLNWQPTDLAENLTNQVYSKAEALLFRPASVSHRTMEADSSNIVFRP